MAVVGSSLLFAGSPGVWLVCWFVCLCLGYFWRGGFGCDSGVWSLVGLGFACLIVCWCFKVYLVGSGVLTAIQVCVGLL